MLGLRRRTRHFLSTLRSALGSGENVEDSVPRDHDVIRLKRYRAQYFPIPKVANSSLRAVAVELLKDEIDRRFRSGSWRPKPFRNPEGRAHLKERGILLSFDEALQLEHEFRFGFVRNPWDRLLSCYANKLADPSRNDGQFRDGVARSLWRFGDQFRGGMSFAAFVDAVCGISDTDADSHFRSQYCYVTRPSGESVLDFIGRFETLSDDFRAVAQRCAFPEGTVLPHLLRSGHADYRQHYEPRLVHAVGDRYARDIALYDYDF